MILITSRATTRSRKRRSYAPSCSFLFVFILFQVSRFLSSSFAQVLLLCEFEKEDCGLFRSVIVVTFFSYTTHPFVFTA